MSGYLATLTAADRAVWETLHDAPPGKRLEATEVAKATGLSVTTVRGSLGRMKQHGFTVYWQRKDRDRTPVRVWWLTPEGRRAATEMLRRYAAGS